jgi:hypothetical protein
MPLEKKLITKNGKPTWEVYFGADDDGRRIRKYWPEDEGDQADDAIETYEKEVKKAGEFWARLSDQDRRDTVFVLEKIRQPGTPRYLSGLNSADCGTPSQTIPSW